jgi:hypothetical protein
MIDPQTGALAAGGVAPQIGPSMTQAAFLASGWGGDDFIKRSMKFLILIDRIHYAVP